MSNIKLIRFSENFSERDAIQRNTEDALFDMFRNESSDKIPIGKFLAVRFLIKKKKFFFKETSFLFKQKGTTNIWHSYERSKNKGANGKFEKSSSPIKLRGWITRNTAFKS